MKIERLKHIMRLLTYFFKITILAFSKTPNVIVANVFWLFWIIYKNHISNVNIGFWYAFHESEKVGIFVGVYAINTCNYKRRYRGALQVAKHCWIYTCCRRWISLNLHGPKFEYKYKQMPCRCTTIFLRDVISMW